MISQDDAFGAVIKTPWNRAKPWPDHVSEKKTNIDFKAKMPFFNDCIIYLATKRG
jgi:hypothetical protein